MWTVKSLVLTILFFVGIAADSPPGDVVGKLVVGYQGWFAAPGDNSPRNAWVHWNRNQITPGPNNVTFELYPDVREYIRTYQTNLGNLGNGQPAKLFSSWDDQTVQTHFRWMQQYNIDVAEVQRFGIVFGGAAAGVNQMNGILDKVRVNAQNFGRKFYVMYDTSGWNNFATELPADVLSLNGRGIFNSPAYARQNGKVVIGIWGFGFTDRPSNIPASLAVIRSLQQLGCYVIGGIPSQWRSQNGNSLPGYLPVYLSFDMIQPWSVGTFGDINGAINYKNIMTNDLNVCRNNTARKVIDYQPILFPGFAWSNWMANSPRNVIPRLHGDFMWQQFVSVRQLDIQSCKVAMFDEYDEGTAIAKAAENKAMIPTNQYFLTLDADGVAVSSDFYLRLTADGNRMMKRQIPLNQARQTSYF